mgnify:FL=1
MPEYRKGAHSVYDIQYHFVWVTKYRYQVLKGEVARRARELIRQSCMSRDIQILQGHISGDHVHILVSSPPSLSPSKIMQYVKGRTSRMLQDEFSHLKKRYWGQHLWARGYYCGTVGTVTDEQIRAYIERHEQEPFPDNFKIDE